jgi:hypothetical protein
MFLFTGLGSDEVKKRTEKINQMTQEEISLLCAKIGKPTYEFFSGLMKKEVGQFLGKGPVFKYDLLEIISISAVDIFVNIFKDVKKFIEEHHLTKIEFDGLMFHLLGAIELSLLEKNRTYGNIKKPN